MGIQNTITNSIGIIIYENFDVLVRLLQSIDINWGQNCSHTSLASRQLTIKTIPTVILLTNCLLILNYILFKL